MSYLKHKKEFRSMEINLKYLVEEKFKKKNLISMRALKSFKSAECKIFIEKIFLIMPTFSMVLFSKLLVMFRLILLSKVL